MISHRQDACNFIRNGFADYLNGLRGLRITDKGRELLRELVDLADGQESGEIL